jgi:hypothetical protein
VGSRVGEAYEDISTVVLNILQAEFGTAPATEESKKAQCSSAAFPKLLCSEKQEHRFLLLQCHTPPWRTVAHLPCLPLIIKDSQKEDVRLLDEGRLLDGGGFLLGRGFWLKGNCWREDC